MLRHTRPRQYQVAKVPRLSACAPISRVHLKVTSHTISNVAVGLLDEIAAAQSTDSIHLQSSLNEQCQPVIHQSS